jgi:hypothetical protein
MTQQIFPANLQQYRKKRFLADKTKTENPKDLILKTNVS